MDSLQSIYDAQATLAKAVRALNGGAGFSELGKLLAQLATTSNEGEQYDQYASSYVSLQTFDAAGIETTDTSRKLAAKNSLISYANRLRSIMSSISRAAITTVTDIAQYITVRKDGALLGYILFKAGHNNARTIWTEGPEFEVQALHELGTINRRTTANRFGLYYDITGNIQCYLYQSYGNLWIILPLGTDVYLNTPSYFRIEMGPTFNMSVCVFTLDDGSKYAKAGDYSFSGAFTHHYWDIPDLEHETYPEYTAAVNWRPFADASTDIPLLVDEFYVDKNPARRPWSVSGDSVLDGIYYAANNKTLREALEALLTAIDNF